MPPNPTVLAFDTSAAHCAAALMLDGAVHTRVEEMTKGQGERLVPFLEALLQDHGLSWDNLDAIGVGIGPGNFTGIRIAVSTARGLSLGLGIPAVGVSMFDTTRRLADHTQVAVPAPRDQVYFMDFSGSQPPAMIAGHEMGAAALSNTFNATDHVDALARLTAERADAKTPRPAPLYVKPPDAAPPREQPPVILP